MIREEILIVDGYNMIGAWPELVKLKAADKLADARDQLLAILSEYRKYEDIRIIVVFDAQLIPGTTQRFNKTGLEVVFTDQDVTADSYIEALSGKLNKRFVQVTVATSDQAEQWTVFSRGALRISNFELFREIQRVKAQITNHTKKHFTQEYQRNSPWNVQQLMHLEKLRNQLSDKK